MTFYTIYLSTGKTLFEELEYEIYKLDSHIIVTRSPYISLTLRDMMFDRKPECDLPEDTKAIYVNISDANDFVGKCLTTLHKLLINLNNYFVVEYTHSTRLWTSKEIKYVAEQLVNRIHALNEQSIWLGGELDV